MPWNVETTPPPRIGKIGPYTVFITPPSTPSTPTTTTHRPISDSPKKTVPASPPPLASPPVQSQAPPPAVQAPPSQFYNTSKPSQKSHSTFGFFWDAVSKVQNAHESLDEHVAYWFGLNQSKYQWALDDYYETKATNPMNAKVKGFSGKIQNV
ncbi:hypothetical protein ACH5RR_006295 [Cinchona calisaya]|uniref:Hydroxyproline-rich glycoprotein family protein n=1 Tax=Cinchona calisaya TaxID=153742 RepID=A0ABD3ANX4_9GENT